MFPFRPVRLALALFIVARAGVADEDPSPKPAPPRVRVTTTGQKSLVGDLAALTPDEIVLVQRDDEKDKEVRLKRAAVARLEVSQRRSNRSKVIGIGFVSGVAAGTAVGLATRDDCSEIPPFCTFDGCAKPLCFNDATVAGSVVLGALIGSAVGLVVSHGEKWQATTPESLRLVLFPRRGGIALKLAFEF
jgi:hypothetical protein